MPTNALRSMSAEVRDAFPDRKIVWSAFYEQSPRGGLALVRRDRVHIAVNTYAEERDQESQQQYLQYVSAHELAHVIAKARRRGVYVDVGKLSRPSSALSRPYVSQLVSVVEHPVVHAIMQEYGMDVGDEQRQSVQRLLEGPVDHFVGMEQRLDDYRILSVALDLVGLMTAFKTESSEAMLARIGEGAPAFTQYVKDGSREVERLGLEVADGATAARKIADILGHPELKGFITDFDVWLASLPVWSES